MNQGRMHRFAKSSHVCCFSKTWWEGKVVEQQAEFHLRCQFSAVEFEQ
jgi:hypothetical protein